MRISPPSVTRVFSPVHTTIDKGHGRIETRTLQTTTDLNDYLDFPYCGQVFRLLRERIDCKNGQRTTETVYGITSLTPKEATPAQLLGLNRGHWSIENKSHYVRDMAYDEDRQQIRRKNGPRVMATLRNFAMSLLRQAGYKNMTSALRCMAAHIQKAFCLLGLRC